MVWVSKLGEKILLKAFFPLDRDSQNPNEHDPEQPAVIDAALNNGLRQGDLQGTLPTSMLPLLCDSLSQ